MSGDRLSFLILTTVFLALYSLSSVAGRSTGVAVESSNGTRKMDTKNEPSVKVTDANAEVAPRRSMVTEHPGERRMEGSAVTGSTLNTEKPSTVRNTEGGAKNTTKINTTEAQSSEDEEEDDDDYYDEKTQKSTNIVDAPCAEGLQRDPNGTCRQHLD